MVATWTAAPLLTPPEVMMAVRLPVFTGLMENLIVSEVAEARVTVPTAPLLKVTVLLAKVGLNPKPLITMLDVLRDRLAVLAVTTGVKLAT